MMIQLQNVSRRFGPVEAVRNLSLEIGEGEIFGLVGPDGAGKTTTLRILCGLMDPDEGEVRIAGLEVARNIDAVKDQIGYMAQKFGLYGDLTVEENMVFYSDLFGVPRDDRDRMMKEFLEMTRMTPFRGRAAAKLSGGMKQKLALMSTLLHRPRVLLLDEPTNGVDPLSRRDFWEILYRLAAEGMTILVSTAYLDEAERCVRVGLMHRGRMIRCAPPQELKSSLAPRCYRAVSGDLREARNRLTGLKGVLGAEPAGAALHLYLTGERPAQEISAESGVPIEPVDPRLEDVFIALIKEEEHHAAA